MKSSKYTVYPDSKVVVWLTFHNVCVYQRIKMVKWEVILWGEFPRKELLLCTYSSPSNGQGWGWVPVPQSDLLGGVSTRPLRVWCWPTQRVRYQSPQDPESRKCLGDERVPLPPHSPALTLEGLENWLARWGWKGCWREGMGKVDLASSFPGLLLAKSPR